MTQLDSFHHGNTTCLVLSRRNQKHTFPGWWQQKVTPPSPLTVSLYLERVIDYLIPANFGQQEPLTTSQNHPHDLPGFDKLPGGDVAHTQTRHFEREKHDIRIWEKPSAGYAGWGWTFSTGSGVHSAFKPHSNIWLLCIAWPYFGLPRQVCSSLLCVWDPPPQPITGFEGGVVGVPTE